MMTTVWREQVVRIRKVHVRGSSVVTSEVQARADRTLE